MTSKDLVQGKYYYIEFQTKPLPKYLKVVYNQQNGTYELSSVDNKSIASCFSPCLFDSRKKYIYVTDTVYLKCIPTKNDSGTELVVSFTPNSSLFHVEATTSAKEGLMYAIDAESDLYQDGMIVPLFQFVPEKFSKVDVFLGTNGFQNQKIMTSKPYRMMFTHSHKGLLGELVGLNSTGKWYYDEMSVDLVKIVDT
jgi:hypothetical protein